MSRLVLTHSTHAPKVIDILKSLCKFPEISTITPGRLRNTKRHSPFRIHVTTPILGGYKLLARSGGMVQEVFVITTLGKSQLQDCLDDILVK